MSLVSDKLARQRAYDPGVDVPGIHLDANESFLPLPAALAETVAARVAALNFNRYPDPLGRGVCAAFGRYYGVDARFVTPGNGSDELITLLYNVFLRRGDQVLLALPDFSMYPIYAGLAEIGVEALEKNEALAFDPDALIARARETRVKLVLFSNPCNPTSQGISAADALRIADSLPDTLVVVDEAYMDFWDEAIVREAPGRKNLIVLKTLSKVGLAAIRLGFAVANETLSGYMRTAKSPYNVNSLTQAAGQAVLEEEQALRAATAAIRASRDALRRGLLPLAGERLRVYPAHANFVTVGSPNAKALHARLLEKGVSVRCVGERLLRITAGSETENGALLAALAAGLKEEVPA